MTDLHSLLGCAAGAGGSATPADLDADLSRGRRALRRRRAGRVAGSALALTLLAGVAVAQTGGDTAPAGPGSAVTATDMAFVAYTGDQVEGFRVATAPAGWRIQGANSYVLLLVPPGNDAPADDVELSTFTGKLAVMLESADATGTPSGTPIAVGDRMAVAFHAGDGYGQLHWTDADGHRLVVQWPEDAGWSDKEVADFAAGVEVLAGAQAGRG